jgi:chemotaxis protein methyltransferase CheR
MSEFLSDDNFETFRNLIYNESGIHFSAANRSILESRLKERLKSAKLESVEEYHKLILANNDELKTLLDSVTTNLTRFFRNAAHMDTFEKYVIPQLVEHKRKSRDLQVRIWSAGCSTGEEPYTLAMMLKEHLPREFAVELTGSDLSLKSLMVGKEGYYPETRVSGVPELYLKKHFIQRGSGYQVTDELKNLVTFDYHNLKNDSGLRNLDVIFCRNVLIYFDEAAQKAVVNRFYEQMARFSFLFIGHSESLFGMNTKFEFLKTDWACIYRKQE